MTNFAVTIREPGEAATSLSADTEQTVASLPESPPKANCKYDSHSGNLSCKTQIILPALWLDRNYLSKIGLIARNPGPKVDFTKLKGVRVFHLNVGSRLESRLDQISDILSKFTHKMIFTITESGLTSKFPNNTLKIPNYNFYRMDNSNRKSLGVITFWTKDIKLKTTKKFTSEHTTIIFHEYTLGCDTLQLGTVYRLPNSNSDHAFSAFLESALESIVHSERQILLIGDTNIDLLKTGRKQSEYKDVLSSFEMKQHIRYPTRACGNSATLIDHIVTAGAIKIDKIANTNIMISDHHLIGCRIKSFGSRVKPQIEYQTCQLHAIGNGLNYKKCNITNLATHLVLTDWQPLYNTLSVETMWESFSSTLIRQLQAHTPMHACKCGRRKNTKPSDQPWYNQNIKQQKIAADEAYKLYRNSGRTQIMYDMYKQKRNAFNYAKEKARTDYYKTLITSCESYKDQWKVVNKIRGKEKGKTGIDRIKSSGIESTDQATIANCLNSYFSSIGQTTLDEVTTMARNSNTEAHGFPRNSPANTFSFQLPSHHEIEKAFAAMKSNKPAGPTAIPPNIIKTIAPFIAQPIRLIFSACIITSTVPKHFKVAHVTPIFKKGDTTDPTNYRPIAVTGVFSKLFEQILLFQIQKHLDRFKVLAPSQYGFRARHSTVHAMIDSLDYAFECLNKKQDSFVSFLYLDLSKAFDCIDHKRLELALNAIGFDHSSINLIIAYLSNRSQAVKLGNTLSASSQTNCGVPQGSLLGPLIFSIYINDCYRMLSNGFTKIVQYADDVCMVTCADTIDRLIARTEKNLLAAQTYFTSIGLKLNVSKTQYVPSTNAAGLRNQLSQTTLNANLEADHQVHALPTAIHLGLTVDSELNFCDHKQKTISKLKSAHALIRSIRNKLTSETAENLYNSLFLSTHDYAAAAYATTGYGTAEIGNKIEVIHRKMIKCVHNNLPWDISNLELYEITSRQTLESRRKSIVAKMAHDCIHGQAPPLVAEQIKRSHQTDRATSEFRVVVPLAVRTNLFKNSFSYRASSIWNTLPAALRTESNKGKFKASISDITN
jgi:hypothetical protein